MVIQRNLKFTNDIIIIISPTFRTKTGSGERGSGHTILIPLKGKDKRKWRKQLNPQVKGASLLMIIKRLFPIDS